MEVLGVQINDKTTINLFAVLGAVPIIVGFIVWLTTIDAKASAAQEDLRGVRALLLDVRERIIHIEDDLKHRK